ncbi:HNH endonuclease [Pseudomonas canadensis]|uniref:HNH endonuclease signature motif containing protein n=1 Tax=Pseudomonas canadensis TaxID=915099 RepID=A0ABZ0ZZX1_9PSED|nr:HNH endonuclease signature motif containing protein [Pseudomonas canadensis]WRI22646.1 HNH endonuclease signature motif containing protein [Pseudomonas canadensis]
MNRSDFEAAIDRFKKKDYSAKLVTPDWYLVDADGANYPLKFVYALAKGIHPRDTHTDDAKIAARDAGYEIFDVKSTEREISADRVPNYWWVNHKQTHQAELEGGYIWSPTENQNGARNQTYINLTLVRPGDIVISYAGTAIRAIGVATSSYEERSKPKAFGQVGQNWPDTGWLVPIEWSVLPQPISPKVHLADIVKLLPVKNSPLQINGNGNQGCYLAGISNELGSFVLKLTQGVNVATVERLQELEEQIEEDAIERDIRESEELPPTEREQLVRSRVGQGAFRLQVLKIEKFCRITNIADERFLIASHIKPWRDCSNIERLDGHNGLMLAPHADRLFDRGWISFKDNGDLLVATDAPLAVIDAWGFKAAANVGSFSVKQRAYLEYHRAEIFRGIT